MPANQPAESRDVTHRLEDTGGVASTPHEVVHEMSSPQYQPFTAKLSSMPDELNRSLLENLRHDAKSGNLNQVSDALSMFDAYSNDGERRLGLMEPAMKQFVNDLREKGITSEWSYGQSDRPGFQFTPTGFDAAKAESQASGVPYDMKKETGHLRVAIGDQSVTFSTNGAATTDDGYGGQRPATSSEISAIASAVRRKVAGL